MSQRPMLAQVLVAAALCLPTVSAAAQESKLGADFRRQRERLAEKCGELSFKRVVDCGAAVVTDHPFHLAVGNLAPQNGFGFGLAFVAPQSKPNDDWRINWSADVVGAPSGAWRAGVYAKFVYSHVGEIVVTTPGGGSSPSESLPRPYPTISVYGQMSSLPQLSFFGVGNDSSLDGHARYEMRQSMAGARVAWPVGRTGFLNRLSPTLLGEVNGRWVEITGSGAGPEPSIEVLYTEATAPGLTSQPATLQLGEALRIAPAIGRLQLVYTGGLQQFIAADASSSFRRWTVDLQHEFSLWTTTRQADTRDYNSPNECSSAVDRTIGEFSCPDPTIVTTNRVGTIGFRVLASRSGASDGSNVPFYFQRTIGGSDIDGERLLASYDDYRFRAPNILVFQETFEHVIWGPIGAFLAAEQGRVALLDDSLGDGELRKTFGAGLTLRAGGVPIMTIWWASGGSEGQHYAVTMNASLLGGSLRPSLD
jgi:hypothetical protein